MVVLLTIGMIACRNREPQIVFENNQQDVATSSAEAKIYKLKKKSLSSDIQYSKLNNIDDYIKDTLKAKSVFDPEGGEFIYFQFIATFKGYSFLEKEKDFHALPL